MTAAVRKALGTSIVLVWAGAVALIAVAMVSGCSWLKTESKAVGNGVVDCTTAIGKDAVHQFGPVVDALLAQATTADGKVNWSPVKDMTKGFGIELGGCVLATVVANVLHPAAPATGAPKAGVLELDPVSLRAGFEDIRARQLGGRTFKTDAGTL